MSRARGALALLAAGLFAAPGAWSFVPPANKIAEAVARANESAGRAQALELRVVVQDALAQEKGEGRIRTRPSGQAELELLLTDGRVERRWLVGGYELVTRGGEARPPSQPLLPPLALIQVDTGYALLTTLRELGADETRVDLGFEREHDCYVVGGRRELGTPGTPLGVDSALWVDVESFEPVRIDREDGSRFHLGPPVAFGGIRFPAFIDVEAPGQPSRRLVVEDVVPAGPGR